MKKKLAAWIALGIITIISGLLLSMTNEITKDVIFQQAEEAKVQARIDVLPSASSFEAVEIAELAPLTELYVGMRDGEPQGYVGTVMVKGYGGPVQVIAGVNNQGRVTGLSVGGAAFAETAGLGAKAKDLAFTQQFQDKPTPVRAVKREADRGENTVDAITAATITTNAVTGGVNSIASKVNAYLNPASDEPAEGTTYTASAPGYAGPVSVLVTINEEASITALKVGDEQFAETPGFGAGALEDSFTAQFAGKTIPIAMSDIDAISGATITTQAVVDAINKAFEEGNVVAPAAPEGTAYTAAQRGFAGPVAVFVTAMDDGTITALRIGDAQFAETEGYGANALDAAFSKQFIGKQIPMELGDIDAISGATITTQAVIGAVNQAFEEKLVDESVSVASTAIPAVQTTSAPAVEATPQAAAVSPAAGAMVQGTNTLVSRAAIGSAPGYGGAIKVVLNVASDNSIAGLTIIPEGFAETPGIGDRVAQNDYLQTFLGKALPLSPGDVDVLSGATMTSQAVMEAINSAFVLLNTQGENIPVAEPAAEATPLAEQPPVETPAPEHTTKATMMPQPTVQPKAPALASRAALGSGTGYGGPVRVVLSVAGDNTIAAISILEDSETPSIGGKALEADYLNGFLGKVLPLQSAEVDVLSGATLTSQAVMEAINNAYSVLTAGTQNPQASPEPPLPGAAIVPGGRAALGRAEGHEGMITIILALNGDNSIASLHISDRGFIESTGIGTQVMEPAFVEQFVGLQTPVGKEDVEVISGATISSEAVIEAVNQAADWLIK